MPVVRACNFHSMIDKAGALERYIVSLSPHLGCAFRERINQILATTKRVHAENSDYGYYDDVSVYLIQRDAQKFLNELGLNIDVKQFLS